MIVEFAVNDKIYSATKILPFMANYGRNLRIEANCYNSKILGLVDKKKLVLG